MYKPVFEITNQMLKKISRVEELRSLCRTYRILPEREAFVRKRATVESTHSSTSIEGNPLSFRQVEKVLSSKGRLTREQYADIEVRNYQKSLTWISKRKREKMDICVEDILTLHGIITDSLLDDSRSGKLRQNPVYIVNQDDEVVYDGPDAKIVKTELEALINWINAPDNDVHPVIVAGILHYMLASIHPFADGNGRTARAAVSLYIALKNYDFRESLVLDSYYAVDKKAYYDALKTVQDGTYESARVADLTPWLEYFTDGFLSSAELLAIELQALSIVQRDVSFRRLSRDESDIISYVVEFGAIDLAEAMEILPGLSRRTVQRKLSELVADGYLQVEGEGRATRYTTPGRKVTPDK